MLVTSINRAQARRDEIDYLFRGDQIAALFVAPCVIAHPSRRPLRSGIRCKPASDARKTTAELTTYLGDVPVSALGDNDYTAHVCYSPSSPPTRVVEVTSCRAAAGPVLTPCQRDELITSYQQASSAFFFRLSPRLAKPPETPLPAVSPSTRHPRASKP
jgi:hypothetical protein